MQTIYKIFLGLFVIFIGLNLYEINWRLGIFHEDNAINLYALIASGLGIMLIFILDTCSKLKVKSR